MGLFEQISVNTIVSKPTNVTIIIGIVLLFAFFISLRPAFKKYLKERKVNKSIQHLGSQYLKQVILPDGMGGSVFLDYLILAQNSITLIILKNFRGSIFCAENIEQWTQLIGNKSYKFPNILRQLDSDISSISSLLKGVEVTGLVVFSSDCEFPKGKPEQVKSITEVTEKEVDKQLHSEKLLNAWYRLKEMAGNHSSTQSFAEDYFKDKDVPTNYTLPVVLLLVLISWLVWRINCAT
ncbi:hypothetical protein MNBD_GAMMA23-235 [hydrothermal vent metagenome]|uniref:NERD domain-containing protein n=1 Tax=hydrothermal vent metagenome TaxID=652676 RepID=A0A3B0ZFD1_9ZZZZ